MIEGQDGVSWEEWVALAHACDRYGVGTLFRSDHYLELTGDHPELGSLDAWGTLCALAAVTSRVRLGTMVSPASFRHPSELAKLATTADHVSGGRIDLGLGAGWYEREHDAYGFPFSDTRTRMDILEEQLQVVLGNWSVEPFSFAGVHYQLEGLDAQPKPVQCPHPPLIVGGKAGPRSVRLAATYADEYNTTWATVAEVRERRGRVLAACERAGREPIRFSMTTTVIAGVDSADLRESLGRVARHEGVSSQELHDRAEPTWLIGTVDQVAERLLELAEVGVDRVMCQHLAPDDVTFVELLGTRLAPLVV
jgi:F420-dependent oxidoreductase-like protein